MNAVLPARKPPAPPPRSGSQPPARRERPSTRGAWIAAIVLSIALHALLLVGLRFDTVTYTELSARATRVMAVRPAPGTRIEQILPVAGEVLPEEPEPVVRPRTSFEQPASLPVVRDAPAVTEQPEAAPSRGASSFSELLSPAARNREVWRAPSPIHTPLDPRAEANARLSSRLDAYNDSVALAAAQAARAVDWTATDEDGGRWGVSPEGIHLGDITIPVPINLSPGPGKRDEVAGRVRDWGEIQSQAAQQEGKETFEERVKAVRERKAREREQQKKSEPPR